MKNLSNHWNKRRQRSVTTVMRHRSDQDPTDPAASGGMVHGMMLYSLGSCSQFLGTRPPIFCCYSTTPQPYSVQTGFYYWTVSGIQSKSGRKVLSIFFSLWYTLPYLFISFYFSSLTLIYFFFHYVFIFSNFRSTLIYDTVTYHKLLF